jgi:protein gp37
MGQQPVGLGNNFQEDLMQLSPIEWTNFTANPLRYRDPDGNVVHACIHKSGGCLHCYAEVMAKRWGRKGMPFTAENMKRLTPFLDEGELRRMLTYKSAAGKMCFVGDMTDVFGEWVPDELLDRLFAVFALRSDVTWQVLTKRAERMLAYLRSRSAHGAPNDIGANMYKLRPEIFDPSGACQTNWPLPNVWLGVSAEDQKTADERIPLLLQTPAAIRFVSYEPALGPVNFPKVPGLNKAGQAGQDIVRKFWVIVGGESGPGARPFNIQWARDVIAQCRIAGVSVFVKQLGAAPFLHFENTVHEETPGMKLHIQQMEVDETIRLKDRKGGTMEEWPEDLRCRQFPGDIK